MKNTQFSLALFSRPLLLAMLGFSYGAVAQGQQAQPANPSPHTKPGQLSPADMAGKPEKFTDANAQREQRRIELRAALLANKKITDQATRAAMRDYHLNAQELAQMRQQLGQQLRQARMDGERVKP